MALVDQVLHVMTPAEWGKPIEVHEKWIGFVDENMKVEGDNGRNMTEGEYASMRAMYQVLPNFVPEPVGRASYACNLNIHFLILKLVKMSNDSPETQTFVKLLAQIHHQGVSPNGKYGFHVPTYKGTIPQYTKWHDTWEEAFHHSMKWFVYAEEKVAGPDEEMRKLCNGIFEKVIPRLLRPLETGGRKIRPRLIHGDLWSGNTSTDVDKNMPVIYDGACLGAQRMAKETMGALLAKFSSGYEGWAKEHGEEPVQRVYSPTSYDLLDKIDAKP
ncbi:hypothetical protein N0V93_003953 [Gnomoniopsis smithogilvyi]|uniref:protein-ribulosamine 3-kinase n=1 Tax=Gnomoniopsis smithogilvyi TaxID=1191159 RepID=A0A9W8YZE6_9PEZI|nr:hypothetical protein N0V93_003953 [Gnomoniopsis smithogilvyi]